MEVERFTCVVCDQDHEVVGRIGDTPILHCPILEIEESVMIVGEHVHQ